MHDVEEISLVIRGSTVHRWVEVMPMSLDVIAFDRQTKITPFF